MIRFSIIIVLILNVTALFSQDLEAIKGLLSELDETKGKEKVEILIEISSNYGYQSFTLSEKYARQAEYLSLELGFDTALIRIYRILGASKQYQNQLDSAIYYFTKSIEFSKKIKDEKEIARSSSNLGVIYASDGEYEKAKEIFLSSLEILEKLKDTVSCQQLYNNLGTIYHLQKDYDKSIEYHNKALKHLDSNSVDFGIRISNLADNYFYKGNTGLALDYYNKSIRIFETKDSKYNIAYTYLRIAKLYYELNDLEKAKMYSLQSVNVAKTVNAQEVLVNAYKLLVDIERLNKNYESAFRYNDQYLSIKDSLNTSKNNKLLNELKVQYNVGLKDAELRRKNIEIKSKIHILYSLGAGVLLAVVLIIILIIQIKKINSAYRDLARQNMNFVSAEEELSELKEEIYIKQGLDKLPEDKIELIDKILDLVENKKIYLETDLTIFKFADELGTNKTYVSQEINKRFSKNFSNFINDYRVAEARRLMTLSENSNLTLAAIAEKSGFNSISVFNRSFKRVTGITPSFYLKSIKDSLAL